MPSVRDIAKNSGVHHGDVSRILPLGLLAPDIVEAIVTGYQPVELTTLRLKRLTDLAENGTSPDHQVLMYFYGQRTASLHLN